MVRFISIYFFICVILLSLLFVSSFVRGKTSYAKILGWLSIATQVYILGYLMEINVESMETMLFWNQVQYFGIPFIPVFWLLVCLRYTNHEECVRGFRIGLIFLVPVLTFFMRLTNNWHHLFYQTILLEKSVLGFSGLKLGKGPFYYLQVIYMIVALVTSLILYYQYYHQLLNEEKNQFRLLTATSSLVVIALLLNIGSAGMGIDFSALVMPICVFLIFTSLHFYNFLEIRDLGRDFAFEDSLTGLMLLNAQGKVVDFNQKSIAFFKSLSIVLKEGNLKTQLDQYPNIYNYIEQDEKSPLKLNIDDVERYFSINTRLIENNKMVGRLIAIEDITESEKLKRKLIEIAKTDELTGLYNRRYFNKYAEVAFLQAIQDKKQLCLLMMDLDYFKKINDNYGHQAGDLVLKEMAQCLEKVFKKSDIIGRIGGEEFAVVIPNTDSIQAFKKAEVFRNRLSLKKILYGNERIQITVSIGIASLNADVINFDDLIRLADTALYRAKGQGRNRTVIEEVDINV